MRRLAIGSPNLYDRFDVQRRFKQFGYGAGYHLNVRREQRVQYLIGRLRPRVNQWAMP